MDSVASLLDKDFRNVLPLVTHSDGGPSDNVLKALEKSRLDCVRNHASLPLYFLFNNYQTTQKTMECRIVLRLAWDPTVEQVGWFLDFQTHTEPRKLCSRD